jgi:DNA-binding SARP family transcriptional activator
MIELHLLGLTDVRLSGAPLEGALRATKRVAVLAYLATARPRGYHRRDKLVALFWPDLAEDRARGALRTTLARLRDDLCDDVFLTRGKTEIAIDEARLTCDVCQLDAALDDGRVHAASALYRGDFFDGVHIEGVADEVELWISSERARIRGRLLEALATHSVESHARNDLAEALRFARQARSLAPSDETVAQRLIKILIEVGDHGSAFMEFQDLSVRMKREFDAEPSATTRAFLDSIRELRVPGTATVVPRTGTSTHRDPSEDCQLVAPESVAKGAPDPGRSPPQTPDSTPSAESPWNGALLYRGWRSWFGRAAIGSGALALVLLLGTSAGWLSPRTGPPASSLRLGGPRWESLNMSVDNPPPSRAFESAFLDSTRDALVMIGGLMSRSDGTAPTILRDIWRLTGLQAGEAHRWTRLQTAPGPAPAPTWNALSVYDATHDRALIYGGAHGYSSPCTSDTWLLEHASGIGNAPRWQKVHVTGELPPPHAEMRGFYEPRSHRLVAFAGNDCFSVYLNDAWMLTFDDSTLTSGRWSALQPDSSAGAPSRRNATAVAYDARARRMWVHGGYFNGALSELWRLDHADASEGRPTWHPVHCSGSAPALTSHLAVYDSVSGSMLLFGGLDAKGSARNDVWLARGLADGGVRCSWEHVVPSEDSPLRRQTSRGFLIPNLESLFVIGGVIENVAFLDLWRLDQAFSR